MHKVQDEKNYKLRIGNDELLKAKSQVANRQVGKKREMTLLANGYLANLILTQTLITDTICNRISKELSDKVLI